MDREDFAADMRRKAMEMLRRNGLNEESSDQIQESITIDSENKENSASSKPLIKEDLTLLKNDEESSKNDDNAEPGVFIFRSKKKHFFENDDPSPPPKKNDPYINRCKTTLKNLANEFNSRENEVKQAPICLRKQNNVTSKRKSVEDEQDLQCVSVVKSMKFEDEACSINQNILNKDVVNLLESQGYKRTASEAHLIYDFNPEKQSCSKQFNPKGNIASKSQNSVNPVPKPKRNFITSKMEKEKINIKNISNIYSNPDFQNNVYVQKCKKDIMEESKFDNVPDPSLLSVNERRMIFEKRLRGELDTISVPTVSTGAIQVDSSLKPVSNILKEEGNMKNDSLESDKLETEDDYGTCEMESNYESESTDSDRRGDSQSPKSSESESFHSNQGINEAEHDIKEKVLNDKHVKFASTPKSGSLYPGVSDTDEDVQNQEEYESSPYESKNVSNSKEDESLVNSVLHETDVMFFSSFQSNKKETKIEVPTDALSEVKRLINSSDNASISFGSLDETSGNISEWPNETASFIYMKDRPSIEKLNNTLNNPSCQMSTSNISEKISNTTEDKSADMVKNKILKLEEDWVKQKILLSQQIDALNHSMGPMFLNSETHIEAQKHVLLSELKIEEYKNEIQRLKVENSVWPVYSRQCVRGNVIITNIQLPIETAAVRMNLKDDIVNFLMCIIKCNETVLATDVVPVTSNRMKHDIDRNYIEFSENFVIPDVTADFKIRVEIYKLVIEMKDKVKKMSKNSKKNKFQRFDSRKISHSFTMAGFRILSECPKEDDHLMLNKPQTPLRGTIAMEMKFKLAEIKVLKRGFLTMREFVSGFGSWSRYWFNLNGNDLSYWKYPDDEEKGENPINIIDLKQCVTEEVTVASYNDVFRPHTFIMKFSPPTYLQQFTGLDERLLLAADDESERISWCTNLNEVLRSVRTWSSPIV